MCAMKAVTTDPSALYVRNSSYIELVVERSVGYHDLAQKAAVATKSQKPSGDSSLKLFKMNGAIILPDDISCGGFSRRWTLGNYLQLLVKKSAANVKLGVGWVKNDNSSDISDEVSIMALSCDISQSLCFLD